MTIFNALLFAERLLEAVLKSFVKNVPIPKLAVDRKEISEMTNI